MSLTRRYVERKKLAKSFFNPKNGNLYSTVSRKHPLGEGASLQHALDVCDTPLLYILPMPKGSYLDPTSIYPAKRDWERIEGVKASPWYGDNAGILSYGEKRISINPIGRWFSVPENCLLSDVILALDMLEKLLNKYFQPNNDMQYPVYLQETPARTSMDLLRRKLPVKARYDSLPSDIVDILLHNFSQQRSELLNHDHKTIEDMRLYDGRFFYASCYRHVPIGDIQHDSKNEYSPYIAGFYRVHVTVPSNWQHIGLLPLKSQKQHSKEQGSIYPNIPGTSFESWCSDKELGLAIDHKWPISIEERLLWPQTQQKGIVGRDPLHYWGEGLVTIREEVVDKLDIPDVQKQMIREAVRNLLMHGVGTMHSSQKDKDCFIDDLSELPDDIPLENTFELADGRIRYRTPKELTQYQLDQFQPHWIQYLYCTCKWKVTNFALTLPYEKIITIRTDGVWTDGPCDVPPDTGKIGVFREKFLPYRGPFPYPRTEREILKVMKQAKGA